MGGLPSICLLVKIVTTKNQNRNKIKFYVLFDNPDVSLKIVDCPLLTRKISVAEANHRYLQWNLEKEPAHNNYMESIARAFIVPFRQNQFIQENVFNKAPIRRIAVAMRTNSAVTESFHKNPFNYQ